MRGTLEELRSPSPLERSLPGMFQDDDFACRYVSAFDVVMAPVFTTLDNLPAYLDPETAPQDFLEWLAGWFGLELDATWTLERRRSAVRDIVDLYRWRGTAKGLRAQLQLQLGDSVDVEIEEGGGVSWSPTPGAALPGGGSDHIAVRIRVDDSDAVDRARVEAMVRAVSPAHLACSVDLVGDGGGTTRAKGRTAKKASGTKRGAPEARDASEGGAQGAGDDEAGP